MGSPLQGIFLTQVSCIAGRFFTDWAISEAFWYVSVNFGFSLKLTLTSQFREAHTLLSNLVVLKFWLGKIPVPKLHSIPFQWNRNPWNPGISIFKTHHDSWYTVRQFSLPFKFQIFLHSFLRIGFQNQFPSPCYCLSHCYIMWKLAWLVKNRVGTFQLEEAPEIQRWAFLYSIISESN